MDKYQGKCLCGACQYIVLGQPQAMYLCHCSRCRKETGTIHGANIFFKDAQLQWVKGNDNITHFKLENTRKQRAFCKTCGSPLPREGRENFVVLPAGSIDESPQLEPTAHVFYASRGVWEDKLKELPRFDELPT